MIKTFKDNFHTFKIERSKDQRMRRDLHFSGPHSSPSKVWRLSEIWKFASTIMNFTNNLVCLPKESTFELEEARFN